MVAHVGEVSFQKHRIKMMVVNFKVDAKDRVWLLWASSIRLDESFLGGAASTGPPRPLNIDSIVKLPSTVKLSHLPSHSSNKESAKPVPFVPCVSCGKKHPEDQFHPTPYKTVIKHFEQVVTLLTADMTYQSTNGTLEWPPDPAIITAAGGVGFGGIASNPNSDNITLEDVTIPPVIRQLHTKLTAPAYRRYRKDPLFLYKTAMCCEACFLVYAEMSSVAFQIKPAKAEGSMSERYVRARPPSATPARERSERKERVGSSGVPTTSYFFSRERSERKRRVGSSGVPTTSYFFARERSERKERVGSSSVPTTSYLFFALASQRKSWQRRRANDLLLS
jgi:hypothetical protein